MSLRSLFFLCSFLFLNLAQAEFKVPTLTGPVVDEVGLFDRGQRGGLEQDLINLSADHNIQLQVLVVSDLAGESIEGAAIKVFDQWQLGKKGEDRGILFLTAVNDRKVRIEVGRGLEGDLPDVIASRIIRQIVIPLFKQGQMGEGVIAGVGAIKQVLLGDKNVVSQVPERRRSALPSKNSLSLILFLLFLIGPPILRLFAPFLGLNLGRRSGWGGGGGWSSGGGGWGSGGGSGWSGGGGGSSGGGSSGSW